MNITENYKLLAEQIYLERKQKDWELERSLIEIGEWLDNPDLSLSAAEDLSEFTFAKEDSGFMPSEREMQILRFLVRQKYITVQYYGGGPIDHPSFD